MWLNKQEKSTQKMRSFVAEVCWFSWCHWEWPVWSWPARPVYCCYDRSVYWGFPSYSQSSTPPSSHLEQTEMERRRGRSVRWIATGSRGKNVQIRCSVVYMWELCVYTVYLDNFSTCLLKWGAYDYLPFPWEHNRTTRHTHAIWWTDDRYSVH